MYRSPFDHKMWTRCNRGCPCSISRSPRGPPWPSRQSMDSPYKLRTSSNLHFGSVEFRQQNARCTKMQGKNIYCRHPWRCCLFNWPGKLNRRRNLWGRKKLVLFFSILLSICRESVLHQPKPVRIHIKSLSTSFTIYFKIAVFLSTIF